MRLLLVEDELQLREQLQRELQAEGFAVDAAADGREGLFLAREYNYDLAIIDLGLPEIDGMTVVQSIRSEGKTWPILILTARGSWQDKVEGLDAGADDYLVKPFHVPELMARLNALLRRSAGVASPQIVRDELVLDLRAKSVSLAGEPVELTAYEYKVLEYLLTNPGKVVSKAELTEHIYDQDFDRDSNVIEVFIGRLRKKIDTGPNKLIETLRGQGYRISAP
jgi:two-component system response regulator PhoP